MLVVEVLGRWREFNLTLRCFFFQGPTCSADGINLDGNVDHVNIANSWEWKGTTSFAVYVKYDSIKENSRVFDFRNGDSIAGEPAAGSDLDTDKTSSATLSGTTKSYDIGRVQ